MPCPAFAVTGRRQKAVDQPWPGARCGVSKKLLHLAGGRRQAGQVKVRASGQGSATRPLGWCHCNLLQLRPDECIDRMTGQLRNGRALDRLQRPPVAAGSHVGGRLVKIEHSVAWPSGAGLDPLFEEPNLVVRQFLRKPLLFGWHLALGDEVQK